MKNRNTSIGFSLFELLITIAIISIISAIAVPAYQSYIATANMTKVTANFEESIRLTRGTFTKDESRLAMGVTPLAPTKTEDWLALFNTSGVQAPGGGLAYVSDKDDIDTTGAIYVEWKEKESELQIRRPAYMELVEQRAKITPDSIEVEIKD